MKYLVVWVCDNQIEYLYQFDDQDEAIEKKSYRTWKEIL